MRLFLCIIFAILTFSCNSPNDSGNKINKTGVYPPFVLDLMQQIERFPDSTKLRVQLVDTMDSLNLTKDALAQIDILIAKDSGNYGNWFRKGELAIRSADTALAITSFSNAATIYRSTDVLLTLANVYAAQKNKMTLDICTEVITQNPDRTYIAHSYYIRGLYFLNTGNATNAINNFNSCIQNNYFYIDAYMEIGWIYFDQQKFDRAKVVFETAIAIKPTEAAPHYWTAKCFEKLGQPNKAMNAYQLALNLDNSLLEASDAISRIKAAKK